MGYWKARAGLRFINIARRDMKGRTIAHCCKVKHIETGKVYESMNAAERELGLPKKSISRQIIGHVTHVRGQHFEKVN
jgi:hypothetical protein